MENKELIIKRLTYIKLLYSIALKQSYSDIHTSTFSILSFHDSVEMFLKLVSDKRNLRSDKNNFMDYWERIPELTQKEEMRGLNDRRVNLKHKGILPASQEIEACRVNVTDFFNQSTKAIFDIEFDELSLADLIIYDSVKSYIQKSINEFNKSKLDSSSLNAAYAFNELIAGYESTKSNGYNTPFSFGDNMNFVNSFGLGLDSYDRPLNDAIDKISHSIIELQKGMKIISLGIDFKEYSKFSFLTPVISRSVGGKMHAQLTRDIKWTKENIQFCINFVIESAIKLQQFDFDIDNLTANNYKVSL